jgi:hypothetical protein
VRCNPVQRSSSYADLSPLVRQGLVPLTNSNGESWTQGLTGLIDRSSEYYKQVPPLFMAELCLVKGVQTCRHTVLSIVLRHRCCCYCRRCTPAVKACCRRNTSAAAARTPLRL